MGLTLERRAKINPNCSAIQRRSKIRYLVVECVGAVNAAGEACVCPSGGGL